MSGTNPQWYQDGVIYQLHVRSFFDANDDGIGDFLGLTRKLDYLEELGVTAIWLLPFYPSPLKDDGYDIADYRSIHPNYGTLGDFKTFLREAHRRGLKVITELVVNHTSDQHPWFQRARRSKPGSRWRDFYVWSDTSDRYQEARIIFKDFETSNWSWDPVAHAYYWHRFYHHQPDLNFDNPEVQRAVLQALDHWLGMGVDGLRLDAVPYLYEREGSNCENLPETHAFLKKLRGHVDGRFQRRMLLAEANQWPEDAAAYFGEGDECHAAFHFPLMPRMYMAVHMEDRFPIIDILQQTPVIPENCQWMLFLRNHDELTLEMVTEEERNYMYRIYARDPQARLNLGIRRRLAPLMQNNRPKIELLNGLLFSLPGTPVIYYGDEIGMGDNIYLGDRNGVRTPMQWTADRNAGFSRTNPQQLYLPPIFDYEYHYETINVETQSRNPHSLLSWMRRLINLRKQFPAFTGGTMEFLYPANPKVLAFIRRLGTESVLVVANLSRFAQFVELDLSEFEGFTPVEVFGHIQFPRIGELPYLLTLTPHAFFWFALRPAEVPREPSELPGLHVGAEPELPVLEVEDQWDAVFQGSAKANLERLLPGFLASFHWFGGRGRTVRAVRIVEAISLRHLSKRPEAYLVIAEVDYTEGESEAYLLPLGYGSEEHIERLDTVAAERVVARLQVERDGLHEAGVLYDAFHDTDFNMALLELIAQRRVLRGWMGKAQGRPGHAGRQLRSVQDEALEVTPIKEPHHNSSVMLGNRQLLKLFRRLEEGINPEWELGSFLTESVAFPHVPPLLGAIEYQVSRHPSMTLGILEAFVENQGTAWEYTLAALTTYFERIIDNTLIPEPPDEQLGVPLLARSELPPPPLAEQLFGNYLETMRLLGRRIAELHWALSSNVDNLAFAPEPFSRLYQRSLYQGIRNSAGRTFRFLRSRVDQLKEETRRDAETLLANTEDLFAVLRAVLSGSISTTRIRCHGSLTLGEVLRTENDFVIVDFEGDTDRPLSERRIKASALLDVARMLRSIDQAGYWVLEDYFSGLVVRREDYLQMERWVRYWIDFSSAALLNSYLEVAGDAPFVPQPRESIQTLLDVYMAQKALSELLNILEQQPDRAHVPLEAILRFIKRGQQP